MRQAPLFLKDQNDTIQQAQALAPTLRLLR